MNWAQLPNCNTVNKLYATSTTIKSSLSKTLKTKPVRYLAHDKCKTIVYINLISATFLVFSMHYAMPSWRKSYR